MPDLPLKQQLRTDLNNARRERDKLRLTTLTTLLSDMRNREIELGREVGDEEIRSVLATSIKRRREAAEQMRSGNREELAQKEEAEAEILQHYLPPALGEEEVRALVREAIRAGADDLGKVMKAVMPRTKGRFDGKELNRIVREEL